MLGAILLLAGVTVAATPAASGQPVLPPGCRLLLGTSPLRDADAVRAVAFAADGRTLIALSLDDTVRLWELRAGKEMRRLGRGHGAEAGPDPVSRMLVSRDGKLLVRSSSAGGLRILDLRTGKERAFKKVPAGAALAALSADGRSLVTSNVLAKTAPEGLRCTLWDVARGEPGRLLTHAVKIDPAARVDGAVITAAAFAPDGKTLATAWVTYRHGPMYVLKVGHGVSLWDVATGKERRLGASASTLAFLDGGKTLACADGPGRWAMPAADRDKGVLQPWDVAAGKKLREIPGPGAWGNALAFSPDGKVFAAVDSTETPAIGIWRAADGRLVHRFTGQRGRVMCLAFCPDDRMLATGSDDTTILLWEVPRFR
jgi:WD40 repeat protein